jgi:hypothetical protein
MSNWTPEMVATLRAAAPLNFAKATAMAGDLGVSARSIVAKATSEGIEYVKASKAAKRGGVKKADLANAVEDATGLSLPSLGNLTVADLTTLLAYVKRDVSDDA